MPFRPINERQRQMIQGMSGDARALTVPAPAHNPLSIEEQDAQSEKINQMLLQRALQNQPQMAEPAPPPPRQFPMIQQKMQPLPEEDEENG